MKRNAYLFGSFSLVATALLVTVALGAKGGNGGGGGGGQTPPCDPQPISVLLADRCGESIWIDVNDGNTACDIICHMTRTRRQTCNLMVNWIGGVVVADGNGPLGFHFDPDTIVVAEVTAEGMQTTVCAISSNPGFFDGGLWFVNGTFLEYQPR